MIDLVRGDDGLRRCAWGSTDAMRDYHDTEWGRPVRGDQALFERISLEAFQSGLSWAIILRKRPGFRAAFADFDIATVARFAARDRRRLVADVGIVRNAAKIDATIANARAIEALLAAEGEGAFDRLVWKHAPGRRPRPTSFADVPATSDEAKALAKTLKAAGLRFVGPTTAYAAMQAVGLVDDHLSGCHVPRNTP